MKTFNAEVDGRGQNASQDRIECPPLEGWAQIQIPGKYLHHFWELGLNPVWRPRTETSHSCCQDGWYVLDLILQITP